MTPAEPVPDPGPEPVPGPGSGPGSGPGASIALLVVSDTRAAGTRADATTALVRERLAAAEAFTLAEARIVPDDRDVIAAALRDLDADAILTSGGTGFAPRDVTPEATRAVLAREAPGIAEMLRAETAQLHPRAWLTRAVAGQRDDGTLIVNLPGSPRGVGECLDVLLPVLPHVLAVARGEGHP